MKSTAFKLALSASAWTLAAMAAQAQTGAPAQPDPADDLSEIIVTGSRVITNGNDAPTPITVIAPEQLLATKPAASLYENLTEMPVFSGSRGAANGPVTTSPNAAPGGTQPNGAVSSLNLRNMGPLRTLILTDGHRLPPVSPDGITDPSTLPQMLIQRVDVVTGGVSAVYGSDAITGVVNFVTDSKFTGLKGQLQYGTSQEGDADSYQAGFAGGVDLFGGRGHLIGSIQHLNSDPLYDYERDFTAQRWGVYGNGTTVPYRLLPNITNATASFAGSIACSTGANAGSVNPANCVGQPNVGLTFKQNGVLSAYDAGGARDGLTAATYQNGGDGAYFVNVALRSEQITDQFFTRFDYDLTDTVHSYVAASFNQNQVEGNIGTQRTFAPGVDVSSCNAFLTPAVRAQLGCTVANQAAGTEPFFRFEKQIDPRDNYGIGQNNRLKSQNFYVLAALDGKFGEGYRWDASYTHSEAELKVAGLNQNRQHIYASLDAVVNPANGQIVCRITLTNPSVLPGCIPINAFGPTAASAEAVSYWFDTINNKTENKLDGFSGSLAGSPFNSWAGPIDMALSGEWRKQEMSLASDSLPTDLVTCTGLRAAPFAPTCAVAPTHPNTFVPISGVSQKILEGAYEINLPLLADLPLVRGLNFNGAARYAKYDNDPNNAAVAARSFNATTWKAGVTWDIGDSVTVRWTRSRDFRAPSLYDLYLPNAQGATANVTDYLVGGTPPARRNTGGNPFLEPEVAHTTTLGVVYRPSPDFSVSLDAYRITLRNALYSLDGSNEFVQKTCYASAGTSSTCQLQDRALGSYTNTSAANVMTNFYVRSINIAEQQTEGIDLESSFRTSLFDRPLTLRGLVTYQPHLYYYVPFAARQDVAGVAYPQVGGFPAPVWKASLFLNYRVNDRLSFDLSERFRSNLHFSSDPTLPNEIGGVPAVAYTNVTATYDVPSELQQLSLFLNVQNLFDKDPPVAGGINNQFPGAFPSNYAVGDDVIGRYFTVGVRMRF